MKSTAPGSLLYYICLCDLFSFAFIFRSIKTKIQKYLAALYFILRLFKIYLSNLSCFYPVYLPISGAVPRKGLTTPLIRRVSSICYLCAGAVHVVLRGSPIGSITLVSLLREIPTISVLHHPFLFGKNTDADMSHHVAPPTARCGPVPRNRKQDPREGPCLARRTTPRPPEERRSLCKHLTLRGAQ